MWKEMIITEVTRMGGDRVCVAGIDHQEVTIRPDVGYPGVRERQLYRDGQAIIRPRAVVNMNLVPDEELAPPHTEDHRWLEPEKTELLRRANDPTWRSVLQRTSHKSVADIFEVPLHDNRVVQPGTGARSLGTIKPASIDQFVYRKSDGQDKEYKYRLSFSDSSGAEFVNLSISDLSLRYYVDYLHFREKEFTQDISATFTETFKAAETWLRLGLTRPFAKSEEDSAWCYIQVTGIYTFPDYLNGACFADFANS